MATKTKAKTVETTGGRKKKAGLNKPQVRILGALAKAKAPFNKGMISEKAAVDPAWVGPNVGLVDPERRAEREKIDGRPSLITLGYVKHKMVPLDNDRVDNVYEITASGRKALEKALKEAAEKNGAK